MTEILTLKGASKGYKRGSVFEFTNGRIWEQTEHNYNYSYSYRSDAILDACGSRGRLKLDGMSDWVEVKRLR